jgi:MFS family permease
MSAAPAARERSAALAGWIVVGVSFLALAAAQSTRAALGLAMPLWEAEFGWSRSLTSGAAAGAFIVTALVAPVAGDFVDRFGARALLLVGLIVLALAMTAIGLGVSEAWAFLLLYCIGGGIGFGVVAVHAVSTIVAHAFERGRGLATGVATSGSTAGQLLVVPALAWAIVDIGWRPR